MSTAPRAQHAPRDGLRRTLPAPRPAPGFSVSGSEALRNPCLTIKPVSLVYHPYGCYTDGWGMVMSVHELRPKAGDTTEKITINLGLIDLGQIDLLVQEGFYSNRTDL